MFHEVWIVCMVEIGPTSHVYGASVGPGCATILVYRVDAHQSIPDDIAVHHST